MVRRLLGTALFATLAVSAHAQELSSMLEEDPNAYVLAVQEQLSERGLYSGPLHGLLTRDTARAIDRFCTDSGIARDCAFGPLTARAAEAIGAALGNDPAMETAVVDGEGDAPVGEVEDVQATTPDSEDAEAPNPATAADVVASGASLPPPQDGSSLEQWVTYLGSSQIVDGTYRVSGDDSGLSARQAMCFETEVGRRYGVSADVIGGTADGLVVMSTSINIMDEVLRSPVMDGSYEGEFVATADETCALLVALTAQNPEGYSDFDNVVISLVQ